MSKKLKSGLRIDNWEKYEIEYVMKYHKEKTHEQLAKALNRSVGAVGGKIRQLIAIGLLERKVLRNTEVIKKEKKKSPKGYLSFEEVARIKNQPVAYGFEYDYVEIENQFFIKEELVKNGEERTISKNRRT